MSLFGRLLHYFFTYRTQKELQSWPLTMVRASKTFGCCNPGARPPTGAFISSQAAARGVCCNPGRSRASALAQKDTKQQHSAWLGRYAGKVSEGRSYSNSARLHSISVYSVMVSGVG